MIPRKLRRHQKGFTFAELLVATGILGILSGAGASIFSLRGVDLAVAQDELRGSLDQAFAMARNHGCNITLSMKDEGRMDVLPVRLPRSVKWGKPAGIPLPPGVQPPKKAATDGESLPSITVTPRRTATAALWFVNDGSDALCMRLNGHGHVLMYRWRSGLSRWVKV